MYCLVCYSFHCVYEIPIGIRVFVQVTATRMCYELLQLVHKKCTSCTLSKLNSENVLNQISITECAGSKRDKEGDNNL